MSVFPDSYDWDTFNVEDISYMFKNCLSLKFRPPIKHRKLELLNLKYADGVYEGESETELVKVKVSVEVKDGTIKDVKILKHDCGLGGPANALADKIKEKNDVEIDAVSGATASSKVIKDAVRKALRKGIK